jgi:hypothetical protein
MNAVTPVDGGSAALAGMTTGQPRAGWLPMVVAVWLALTLGLLVFNLPLIETLEFRDPDDELRLVQVRDLLAGQAWFDLTQYRVASASGGVPMHWSRLVDLPIVAIIWLLRPLLGQPSAELAALLAVPALTLLAMLALVGWMASRTLSTGGRFFALVALGLSAPVLVQSMPLRIDHHGWQIVLALAAVAAFLVRDERRGGWLSGAALAAWMAISFEGLPFSAWFVAVLGGWALVEAAMRTRLVAAMQSLAATSAALFAATRGLAALSQHCDAIAPVHLAIFGWGALAISIPGVLLPGSRAALAAGLGAGALGALALVGSLAPQCTTGSFDMLDPVVRGFWYDSVQEGKPLWRADWQMLAQYLVPALVGLWSACLLAKRSEGALRRWWVFYALILGGAIAISLLVTRSAAFSGALAALPLGWRFAAWLGALRRPPNLLLRLGELAGTAALIFLVLFPAIPVAAVEEAAGATTSAPAGQELKVACNASLDGGALSALPPGDILAPLDFGPNILLNSDKGVLATGHHRGAPAMRAVIDAFTGSPERARAVMETHRLRYVLICPNVQEMDLYREKAPEGFAAQMLDGDAPAWLRPVSLPKPTGLLMWERVE